jgi:hypothetical protein
VQRFACGAAGREHAHVDALRVRGQLRLADVPGLKLRAAFLCDRAGFRRYFFGRAVALPFHPGLQALGREVGKGELNLPGRAAVALLRD